MSIQLNHTLKKILVRGEPVSALTSMSVDGMLTCKLVRGSVNGDVFIEFVETKLIPSLMLLNGITPRSVVVMNNCSIHHVN